MWVTAGGELVFPVTATVPVTGLGPYVFSGANLVTDVQDMLDVPATNFGWIIVGDESKSLTALRLPSRENATPQERPQLTVEYEPLVPTDAASMGQLKSAFDK